MKIFFFLFFFAIEFFTDRLGNIRFSIENQCRTCAMTKFNNREKHIKSHRNRKWVANTTDTSNTLSVFEFDCPFPSPTQRKRPDAGFCQGSYFDKHTTDQFYDLRVFFRNVQTKDITTEKQGRETLHIGKGMTEYNLCCRWKRSRFIHFSLIWTTTKLDGLCIMTSGLCNYYPHSQFLDIEDTRLAWMLGAITWV